MVATIPSIDKLDFDKSAVIRNTSLGLGAGDLLRRAVVSRQRRQRPSRFRPRLRGRFLITLVSYACYVITWEIFYFKVMPDFGDKYAAHMVERVRASGATPERVEAAQRDAASFKEMYDKPPMNMALTFTEPFPIGLVMTLISAGILRRRVG